PEGDGVALCREPSGGKIRFGLSPSGEYLAGVRIAGDVNGGQPCSCSCRAVRPRLAHTGRRLSLPALPTFARSPDPQTTNSWSGLVVGSEMFALSQKGAKGHVGGDGFVGYNHELDNNLVIGVQASAGYAPSLFARGPANGYDFAMTSVNVGYDMGRFMPY